MTGMPTRPARTSDEVIVPMRQSKPILRRSAGDRRRLAILRDAGRRRANVAGAVDHASTSPSRRAPPPILRRAAIAQELTRVLGQPVIVENRTGGRWGIASATVAKAPPDGYTLLVTTIGPAVLRPLHRPQGGL